MISTYNVYPKLVLGIEVSVSLIGILLMLISVVGIIVRCSETALFNVTITLLSIIDWPFSESTRWPIRPFFK